jgi:PPM family protein phosphatase
MTPTGKFRFECAALTDRGRVRPRNEDSFFCAPDRALFAVADGMGGHRGGNIASRTAIATLDATLPMQTAGADAAALLRNAVAVAQRAIEAECVRAPELSNMGTTLTAVWAPADGPPLIAHVGDSRLYRVRGGAIVQVTRDDSWVQDRVDSAELTAAEARNHPYSAMLTRALGVVDRWQPAIHTLDLQAGDLLLLCSDGLTGMLEDAEILDLANQEEAPLEQRARDLVGAANDRGGLDNITVVLALSIES